MGGPFPWRLRPADVWRLMRDGFNANEIAHIGGVARHVALTMMLQAERQVAGRERQRLRLRGRP